MAMIELANWQIDKRVENGKPVAYLIRWNDKVTSYPQQLVNKAFAWCGGNAE